MSVFLTKGKSFAIISLLREEMRVFDKDRPLR